MKKYNFVIVLILLMLLSTIAEYVSWILNYDFGMYLFGGMALISFVSTIILTRK